MEDQGRIYGFWLRTGRVPMDTQSLDLRISRGVFTAGVLGSTVGTEKRRLH